MLSLYLMMTMPERYLKMMILVQHITMFMIKHGPEMIMFSPCDKCIKCYVLSFVHLMTRANRNNYRNTRDINIIVNVVKCSSNFMSCCFVI